MMLLGRVLGRPPRVRTGRDGAARQVQQPQLRGGRRSRWASRSAQRIQSITDGGEADGQASFRRGHGCLKRSCDQSPPERARESERAAQRRASNSMDSRARGERVSPSNDGCRGPAASENGIRPPPVRRRQGVDDAAATEPPVGIIASNGVGGGQRRHGQRTKRLTAAAAAGAAARTEFATSKGEHLRPPRSAHRDMTPLLAPAFVLRPKDRRRCIRPITLVGGGA